MTEDLKNTEIIYVTTLAGLKPPTQKRAIEVVPDCNRNTPIKIAISLINIIFISIKYRPNLIITTGALPGLIAIFVGKILKIKTIWIDSVANAEELSQSGTVAKKHATICLSQWEHVANNNNVDYQGRIL